MRNRKSMMSGGESTENYWPAFADLTSTIALILFVLVLLAYLQNLISGKNLEHVKSQLDNTLARLDTSRAAISRSEKKAQVVGGFDKKDHGRGGIRTYPAQAIRR